MLIITPFLYAILVPFFRKYLEKVHTGWFVLPVPVGIFACLVKRVLFPYPAPPLQSVPWIPSLGIHFSAYGDGLALLFGLLISGIGALVVVYSIFYLAKEREALGNFYVYLLMFMGAMLGVVFSDNVLVLYLFWEWTSIASFLLIAFWYERRASRYGAQKSLLITVLGGFAMLAGFLLLANITDTFSIRAMIVQRDTIFAHPSFGPAMVLILLGACTKSAQFPFHIWLPDAMEAPTPVSAYLHSATMVKAGIYLIARFTPIFGGSPAWFWVVSAVGLVTLFWGAWSAVRQVDLKAMLAFSTISQLGLITCLMGAGSPALYYGPGPTAALYTTAILAGVFHLINHSIFKGCLFMTVGIIDYRTGTRDIRKLGGLMSLMPITFTIAVIGSFSMAGLPPFSGFFSKELFFTAMLNASELNLFNMETWGLLFPVVAWIASVFTFTYCMIFVFKAFLGKHKPQKLEKKAREAYWGLLFSPAILAALVMLFFFFPDQLVNYLIIPAVASILPGFIEAGPEIGPIVAWHGWTPELMMTLGVVAVGSGLFLLIRNRPGLYRRPPEVWSLNYHYDQLLERSEAGFYRLNRSYMTGSLHDYLLYIFLFLVLVLGAATIGLDAWAFDAAGNSPITIYEGILALVLLGSALVVLFARQRLIALIGLGVMGYVIVMFFVIFRAPDLALTQMVVETFTLVIFLLCFYFLPELKTRVESAVFQVRNAVVAGAVGLLVMILAWSAAANRAFPPISRFFENAYELAGAKNIVNAILVDFRGFDTMLEILVLCMGGLGVYTLIRLRSAGRNENANQ